MKECPGNSRNDVELLLDKPMSSPSQRDPPYQPACRRQPVCWWPLCMMMLLGGGLLYTVQIVGISVFRPTVDFAIVVVLINVLVYSWVRVWSRFGTIRQIVAIVFMVSIQASFMVAFRIDEFTGDGRILFRWRWSPTPEQLLHEFSSKADDDESFAKFAKTQESDSPSYRGADRTGRYSVPDLDLVWNERVPRELWRHPVGRGWSSFAVVGDYCVTQEQRGPDEAVVCYELRTGKEVWKHLNQVRFEEITSGPGPRATPTIYGERVFALGATGILECLNGADGRVIWSYPFGANQFGANPSPLFGYASSPLIHANRLYVSPGGNAGSLVALDIDTGEVAWSRDSRKPGYGSPQLFHAKAEEQILVFDAAGLHGYEAVTGEHRWSFPWGDNSDDRVNVCQPVILPIRSHNANQETVTAQLFISSGYGRGCALISLSRLNSGAWTADSVWQAKTLKSKFSDVIVNEGHAYGLDEGILTCISLTDGARRWKSGRYGYGQIILVNHMLLIQAESGRIVLVRASPDKFVEVASLDALHDRTWNQPVVAGRHLLLRNDREAVCFELPVAAQSTK